MKITRELVQEVLKGYATVGPSEELVQEIVSSEIAGMLHGWVEAAMNDPKLGADPRAPVCVMLGLFMVGVMVGRATPEVVN